MCTTGCNCTVYYFINESYDNVLAHEFPPVQVWSPNCPGFCSSNVCSRDGDREQKQSLYKHSLKNLDLAPTPVFGVILQPKAWRVGYLFNTQLMNSNSSRSKFLLLNPECLRLCQLEGEGRAAYLAFLTITEHPLVLLWSGFLLLASLPEWLEDLHFVCCKAHNSEQASGMQQQLLFLMSLRGSRHTRVPVPIFQKLFLCAHIRVIVQERGAASGGVDCGGVGEIQFIASVTLETKLSRKKQCQNTTTPNN